MAIKNGYIVQRVGQWLSRVGLSYREWACGYLEWVYCSESGSRVKSGSIVQKVGLWLTRVGLLYKEWVCGYQEWLCRPEIGLVAI